MSPRPANPPTTELESLVPVISGQPVQLRGAAAVTGICLDSRRVQPGDLYAALPGRNSHGMDFLEEAVRAGAVAVLSDREPAAGLPALVVPEPRRCLGEVSSRIYGDPALHLAMVGVTGTQGKTTTTRILHAGLPASGLIGTTGVHVGSTEVEGMLTTPEAPDLHAMLAVMREQHLTSCVMEISSHALDLGRVDGVRYAAVAFLNLGRDHLDYHVDMAGYFAAKASLFRPERAERGIINITDDWGRRLAEETVIDFQTLGPDGDWWYRAPAADSRGTTFVAQGPDGLEVPVRIDLPGEFNVENTLTALALAVSIGADPADFATRVSQGVSVPGRLERVPAAEFEVLVDYAHKPDALAAVLKALRPQARKLIVVVGAGGDRDQGKRPLMGRIASDLADLVVVTDDNPRTEDAGRIRDEVIAGATGTAEIVEIGDRAEAIDVAIGRAEAGDVVLIAGKGHETYQEIAGVRHPFDDRVEATRALRERT